MDSVASRYAIAWVKLGEELNLLPLFRQQVIALQPLIAPATDLYHFLTNAFITLDQKYALIDQIFKEPEETHLQSFLKVIVQRKRIKLIQGILQETLLLLNQTLKIKRALIYTTHPLQPEQIKKLLAPIQDQEGVTLEPEVILDPSLIGGIKIEIEGKLYDGSIRQKLQSLKNQLLKRGKL